MMSLPCMCGWCAGPGVRARQKVVGALNARSCWLNCPCGKTALKSFVAMHRPLRLCFALFVVLPLSLVAIPYTRVVLVMEPHSVSSNNTW
jgi:hypothetical protein